MYLCTTKGHAHAASDSDDVRRTTIHEDKSVRAKIALCVHNLALWRCCECVGRTVLLSVCSRLRRLERPCSCARALASVQYIAMPALRERCRVRRMFQRN